MNGRLLVVAAVVCTAAEVVGVLTAAAVVGPSDVEATPGMVMHDDDAGRMELEGVQSAPATLGTIAKEASAKLEPMINRFAHMINAFL